MRYSILCVLTAAIAGCQETSVQTERSETSYELASDQVIGSSVLGAENSGLYEACFDPSEGVCFELLSIETEVEEESETIWSVRTNVEVRFKGRALPISPLRQHFAVGSLIAQRSTGGGQSVTVASGNMAGDLYPGRTVLLTGRNGFRKSDFELPITFEISQFVHLGVTVQTPDGVLWPTYSCRISEGTCYTGPS